MRRPKIGLALGGGSARGFATIGVLRVFEKHKIPIDFIAGTSVGAFIGGLYSAGYTTKDIENIIKQTEWTELLSASDFRTGIIGDEKIEPYIQGLFKGKKFKDLEIPFATTAVNIQKGEEVIFHSGSVASAVQASMAVPGLFTPTQIGNKFYVDGGILDPTPVDILNEKKIGITIAVDLSQDISNSILAHASSRRKDHNIETATIIDKSLENFKKYARDNKILPRYMLWFFKPKRLHKRIHKKSPPLFEIGARSFYLLTNELARAKLELAHPKVVIRPILDNVGMFDLHKISLCIKQGEAATIKKLGIIKKLMKMR